MSEDLAQEANRREQNSGNALPLAVPPADPDGAWQPYSYAVFDALARSWRPARACRSDEPNPATVAWTRILRAYGGKSSEAAAFNQAVQDVLGTAARSSHRSNGTRAKTNFEDDLQPCLAVLLRDDPVYRVLPCSGCFSWLGWDVPLRRAATWLTLFTFVVHTLALAGRIYISGRPPVTSLYSSASVRGLGGRRAGDRAWNATPASGWPTSWVLSWASPRC